MSADETPLVRQEGSVWTRNIYDIMPDCHECPALCDGGHKAWWWRPPIEGESTCGWFKSDPYLAWLHGYPPLPPVDHDFSRGPEYPSLLPGAEPPKPA